MDGVRIRKDAPKCWFMEFTHKGVLVRRSTWIEVGTDKRASRLLALQEANKERERIDVEQTTGQKQITLTAAFDRYYNEVASKENKDGGKAYLGITKRLAAALEADTTLLRDLTAAKIGEVRQAFLTSGKLVQAAKGQAGAKVVSDKGLSAGTVNQYLGVLKAVLNKCTTESWNLLSRVPEIELADLDKRCGRCLTKEEFNRLLLAAGSVHLKRLLKLLVLTGARWDVEMMSLTWDRVDLTRNTGVKLRFTNSKTAASERTLTCGDKVRDILIEMRDEQQKAGVYNPTGRIFMREDDGALVLWFDPTGAFETARKRAGLNLTETEQNDKKRKITLHTLRHTCASWMLEGDQPMYKVQAWMGHSQIQTTIDIYGHLDPNKFESAVAVLESNLDFAA